MLDFGGRNVWGWEGMDGVAGIAVEGRIGE